MLVAAVIITVALVFNYKKIVEFVDERRKARINRLTEALKCEHVNGLTKMHLEEELAKEHFKTIMGISLERDFREAIIQAHRDAKGELEFAHFRRALPHLRYMASNLSVRISWFEHLGYWFNLVFGYLLAFSGLLLMVLPGQIKGVKLVQALSILGLGTFLIAIALFMLYQTFSVVSARRILAELEKAHNNAPPCRLKSGAQPLTFVKLLKSAAPATSPLFSVARGFRVR